ncbi:MAG: glycosyltransferase [Candidatus Diapherotrites archaeon]|nr:glycosyltransferase [Candidatus Diapherotrites archaeon]
MADFLSVGIAAYNEEESIERMLSSVFKSTLWRQTPPGMREVMVCCNGCTDKTEEIVKRISVEQRRGDVKLIVSAPGKAVAWNALVKKMDGRAKVLFFADADVLVHRKALENLKSALSGRALIAAARIVPLTAADSAFMRGINKLSKEVLRSGTPWVTGMLYGVKRDFAESVKMPANIICDDTFLEIKAGNRVVFVNSAKVYYQSARKIRDYMNARIRNFAGGRQFYEMGLLKGVPGALVGKESMKSWRERISQFGKLSRVEKLYTLATLPLDRVAFAKSKSYFKKRKTPGWSKSQTAKLKVRTPRG